MTEMILGCIPCLDGMKYGYTPYDNSVAEQCSRCGIEVWVGPEQKKQQETHGYPIVCMRCVLKKHGPETMKLMQSLRKDEP